MARKPRPHEDDSIHFVTTRGNNRADIFLEEADYLFFLATLAKVSKSYGTKVLAFCLMTNHVHLVLKLAKTSIGVVMHAVLLEYAKYFNAKHRRVGHVFQARFHDSVCRTERDLLACVRYTHLNPVRAGMVADPAEYRWSSHRAYTGAVGRSFVDTSLVLGLFSERPDAALAPYQRFHEEALRDDSSRRPTLSELAFQAASLHGFSVEDIRGPKRGGKLSASRRHFIVSALAAGFYSGDIARFLACNPSTITRAIATAAKLSCNRYQVPNANRRP